MMIEHRHQTVSSGELISMRVRVGAKPDSPTILFVHGLGDSGLAWLPAFEVESLKDYTLIVPDLLGYGETKTHSSTQYSFAHQVKMLLDILEILETKNLVVVGHSMGGVITSLLVSCLTSGMDPSLIAEPQKVLDWLDNTSTHKKMGINLLKFVDVEGNLTEADATISGRAIKADKRGNFPKWFKMFKTTTQNGPWAEENLMLVHYGQSLEKCTPDSFLQGSRDLNTWKQMSASELPLAGSLYMKLAVEKVYYFGSASIPDRTRMFILDNRIDGIEFQGSGHWLMNDAPERFYSRLSRFIRT